MRRSVPSWTKGGPRGRGWSSDHGRCFLLQRRDHSRRSGLRDAEPLRQSGEGAGRGIAEGASRRQEWRKEHVNPLIRFALAHTKQAPLHHLERIGFHSILEFF
jgi:hypothetical protein